MRTLVYNPDLITKTNQRIFEALRDIGKEILKPFQVGFGSDESENALINHYIRKDHVATFQGNTDMGANLQLILITNVSPGETITAATLTQPTGTGYAPIELVDTTWPSSGNPRSYPLQTFTAGAGGFSGNVQGYAIITKPAGTGVARIVILEVDPNGPYTFAEGAKYDITPQISSEF